MCEHIYVHSESIKESDIFLHWVHDSIFMEDALQFQKKGGVKEGLVLQETYEAGIVATFHKSRSLPGSYCLLGAPSHDHWVWKSTGVVGQINFACATYPLRIFDASNNCNKTQTTDLVLV